jgi:hypothetical protein
MKFVYEKYSAAIYGVILTEVSFRKEADIILYDTFITCFFAQPPRPSSSNTSMFIYLRNIAYGFLRKRKVLYISRTPFDIPLPKIAFHK